MQALLLAAGFGTRLRPYTLIRPKPLFPIINIPLLDIILDKLLEAGCKRIVVNAHHLADQIEQAVAGRNEVVFQFEPEILGTGGSLRKALTLFDQNEPVLVMNGDIYHDVDLGALVEFHKKSPFPVTMAMHNYHRFNGVKVVKDKVVSFAQKTAAGNGELLAFTGLHVVNTEIIKIIPTAGFFHIIDLYVQLATESQIGCKRVDGSFWRDIGTPEDYLDLHRELLTDNKRFATSSHWRISPRAEVASTVRLNDWGAIGAGAVVRDGAVLSRCIVWPKARVEAGQHLLDAIIT